MDAFATTPGPLLFAHRGHHVEHPENSLPAFEAALRHGADVLELDVHVTRDGVPVVSHDPTGARTAGVSDAIADCTLAQIKRWALRGPGGGAAPGPVCVPTLEELLEALPGAVLNVDLKGDGPDPVAPVLEVLARRGAEGRVLLTSFSAATLRRLRAAGYGGPVGLGQVEAVHAVLSPGPLLRFRPPAGRRLQIPPRYGPLDLTRPRVIERAHALGLAVDYWVVDDPVQAEALLAAGVDGLVTDRLGALAAVYARSPRTAAWRARHPALAAGLSAG